MSHFKMAAEKHHKAFATRKLRGNCCSGIQPLIHAAAERVIRKSGINYRCVYTILVYAATWQSIYSETGGQLNDKRLTLLVATHQRMWRPGGRASHREGEGEGRGEVARISRHGANWPRKSIERGSPTHPSAVHVYSWSRDRDRPPPTSYSPPATPLPFTQQQSNPYFSLVHGRRKFLSVFWWQTPV